MVGTYVDLADVQQPFLYNQERWLRKRIWPCKVVEEKAGLIRLSGRGEPYWRKDRFIPHKPVYWCDHSGRDRWRFINNKMEWSTNGGPWELMYITPEEVDSCYQRYNPDLYTDIIINSPRYPVNKIIPVTEREYNDLKINKELYSKVLAGSQIHQDNYVVTIQMPSAEAARALINFLESVR